MFVVRQFSKNRVQESFPEISVSPGGDLSPAGVCCTHDGVPVVCKMDQACHHVCPVEADRYLCWRRIQWLTIINLCLCYAATLTTWLSTKISTPVELQKEDKFSPKKQRLYSFSSGPSVSAFCLIIRSCPAVSSTNDTIFAFNKSSGLLVCLKLVALKSGPKQQ